MKNNKFFPPLLEGTKYIGVLSVLFCLAFNGCSLLSLEDEEIVETPIFNPPADTYASDQNVTISCATAGATIYYTMDGSDPTSSSTQYTTPIAVSGNGTTMTIKALAMKSGFSTSAVGNASYTINHPSTATPTFSLPSGKYSSDQEVTISCATSGATIYYITKISHHGPDLNDKREPTTSSTPYTTPISVAGHEDTTIIMAVATAPGHTISAIGSAEYSIEYEDEVAAPMFNPPGGTYTSDQEVTISCATNGSTIYYTTDGSNPTSSSTQYTTPIAVTGNGTTMTITALATAEAYTPSCRSAEYIISYPNEDPKIFCDEFNSLDDTVWEAHPCLTPHDPEDSGTPGEVLVSDGILKMSRYAWERPGDEGVSAIVSMNIIAFPEQYTLVTRFRNEFISFILGNLKVIIYGGEIHLETTEPIGTHIYNADNFSFFLMTLDVSNSGYSISLLKDVDGAVEQNFSQAINLSGIAGESTLSIGGGSNTGGVQYSEIDYIRIE